MARLPPPPSANFLAGQWGSRAAPSQVFAYGDINELSGPARPALGSELTQNTSSINSGRRAVPADANVPKWMQKRLMRQDKQVGQPEQRQPNQNGRLASVVQETAHVPTQAPFFDKPSSSGFENGGFNSVAGGPLQNHNDTKFQPNGFQHSHIPPALSRPPSQTSNFPAAQTQQLYEQQQHQQQQHTQMPTVVAQHHTQPQSVHQPVFQQPNEPFQIFDDQQESWPERNDSFVPQQQPLGAAASPDLHSLQFSAQQTIRQSNSVTSGAALPSHAANSFQAPMSRSPYSYFDDSSPELVTENEQHSILQDGREQPSLAHSSSVHGSHENSEAFLDLSQAPFRDTNPGSHSFPSPDVHTPLAQDQSNVSQNKVAVDPLSTSLPTTFAKSSPHSIDRYFDDSQISSSPPSFKPNLVDSASSKASPVQIATLQKSPNVSSNTTFSPNYPENNSLTSVLENTTHQSQSPENFLESSQELVQGFEVSPDSLQPVVGQNSFSQAVQNTRLPQSLSAGLDQSSGQSVYNLPPKQLLKDPIDPEAGIPTVVDPLERSTEQNLQSQPENNIAVAFDQFQASSKPVELATEQPHVYSFPTSNLDAFNPSLSSLDYGSTQASASLSGSEPAEQERKRQEQELQQLLREREQIHSSEYQVSSTPQQDLPSNRRNSLGSAGSDSRRNSLEIPGAVPSQRRPSIDASLGEPSAAPVRRLSVDLSQNPVPEQQAPSKNSKWAQRAALRKAQQGHGANALAPSMAVSELSLNTTSTTHISRLPNKPSAFLEPPNSLLSPEAPSPTGVAVDAFPVAAPRNTPHHRVSPPLKPLPSSSSTVPSTDQSFSLPPPKSQLPSASFSIASTASASSSVPLPSRSLQPQRRPSLPFSDVQPKPLSLPSAGSIDPNSFVQPSLSLSNIINQETKTIPSISGSVTKKKSGPAPLPDAFDYSLLTAEIVKERTRKRNYPVPFPVFCAMWTKFDTILIAGGGGQAGTGVKSGALICDIKKELPDLRNPRYDNGWSVLPQAEVDTCDYLVYKMAHHPSLNEIVAAVGPRIYRFLVNGRIFESSNFVQSDFSPDLANQLTLSASFSRDGQQLVTGGEDKRVRVWSYPDLRLLKTLGAHMSGVVSVDFSFDGKRIATATGDRKQPCVRVWNVEQGSDRRDEVSDDQGLLKEIRHKLGKNDMEIAVCRWGLGNGTNAPKECLLAIMNASARGPGYLGKFDGISFKLIKLMKIGNSPLVNMEVSHDRNYVVVADNEGHIWVYNIESFTCVNAQKDCHDLPCTSLTWSPDDSMICSASADKSVVFIPKQGPPTKSACASYILLFFHVVVVILIYLLLCPDPSRPWALTKEEL